MRLVGMQDEGVAVLECEFLPCKVSRSLEDPPSPAFREGWKA